MVQALKSGLNHLAKDTNAGVTAMEAKRKSREKDRFHC